MATYDFQMIGFLESVIIGPPPVVSAGARLREKQKAGDCSPAFYRYRWRSGAKEVELAKPADQPTIDAQTVSNETE